MANVRNLISYIDASLRFGTPLTESALLQIREILVSMRESPYVVDDEANVERGPRRRDDVVRTP